MKLACECSYEAPGRSTSVSTRLDRSSPDLSGASASAGASTDRRRGQQATTVVPLVIIRLEKMVQFLNSAPATCRGQDLCNTPKTSYPPGGRSATEADAQEQSHAVGASPPAEPRALSELVNASADVCEDFLHHGEESRRSLLVFEAGCKHRFKEDIGINAQVKPAQHIGLESPGLLQASPIGR